MVEIKETIVKKVLKDTYLRGVKFYIEQQYYEELLKLSKRYNISMSALVRRIILYYLFDVGGGENEH